MLSESEFNPYAPPRPQDPDTFVESSDTGPWQKGKDFYVLRDRTVMPKRSPLTNAAAESSYDVPVVYVKNSIALAVIFGALGALLARALFGDKWSVPVFGSHEDQQIQQVARSRYYTRIGKWLGLTVLLTIVIVFAEMAMIGWRHAQLVQVPLLVALLGSILMTVYAAIAGAITMKKGLVPREVAVNYASLRGACPEFLATLPPWPGIQHFG